MAIRFLGATIVVCRTMLIWPWVQYIPFTVPGDSKKHGTLYFFWLKFMW